MISSPVTSHVSAISHQNLGFLNRRKRKSSDSVLLQKPLHQQKCQKGKVTTQTTPQKVRLHSGCGPT